MTLTNSTVSGNSASWTGGIYNYGPLTVKNSIVANTAGGIVISKEPSLPKATTCRTMPRAHSPARGT